MTTTSHFIFFIYHHHILGELKDHLETLKQPNAGTSLSRLALY